MPRKPVEREMRFPRTMASPEEVTEMEQNGGEGATGGGVELPLPPVNTAPRPHLLMHSL
jgi:hypothetical protein